MKKIWFVSHYAMPPSLEQRVKTLRYAQIMQEKGYQVKMFTASTIHNTNINLIEGKEKYIEKTYDGIDYIHIKTPNYKGSGIKRIINLLLFSNRFFHVAKKFEKPDVIVADVNCVNYRGIYKYCKKTGVKFYCDIRDLWPLSIVEYLGMNNKNLIIQLLYLQEKKLYKVADGVIFSMEGGKQYIIDKKWDKDIDLNKVYNINNGVDLELFEKNKKEFTLNDGDLNNLETFKVVYCGSIRLVNNIKMLVSCAEQLKKENYKVKFLIYGDGNQRKELENYCKENNLDNIVFKAFVDKKYVPYILSKSDCNIITSQITKILKYGISPNKLFDYLASGKPIISNTKCNFDLIERYNCGVTIDDYNVQSTKEAILKIYNLSMEEKNKMCQNASNAAKDFDFKVLTEKLIEIIDK